MKRLPKQTVLPLTRSDKVLNRQIRQHASGVKVTAGLGRPRLKKVSGQKTRMRHASRPELKLNSALHVTVRVARGVPNLRTRRRFSVIKQAFVRFCLQRFVEERGANRVEAGFRLIHFAILGSHAHFIVEADSKQALSMGMQKLLHSLSRRLNALSVKERGGVVSSKGGSYRAMAGWLGRVFADRYHAEQLATPTQMQHAVRYVLTNAAHHYTTRSKVPHVDPFSSMRVSPSLLDGELPLVRPPKGFLLAKACRSQTL